MSPRSWVRQIRRIISSAPIQILRPLPVPSRNHLVIPCIIRKPQHRLFQVRPAHCRPRGLPRAAQRRRQKQNQYRDNRNHHQQFNQRETSCHFSPLASRDLPFRFAFPVSRGLHPSILRTKGPANRTPFNQSAFSMLVHSQVHNASQTGNFQKMCDGTKVADFQLRDCSSYQ